MIEDGKSKLKNKFELEHNCLDFRETQIDKTHKCIWDNSMRFLTKYDI